MDKKLIIDSLKTKIQNEISGISEVTETSKMLVQDGDLKSDGKYDTRGIEAGYLASAQLKRLEELKLELELIDNIPFKNYSESDEVGLGAIIEIVINNINKKYFISTTAGGTLINIDNDVILVISVFSPLGDAVLGLKSGEVFEVETGGNLRQYRVNRILG